MKRTIAALLFTTVYMLTGSNPVIADEAPAPSTSRIPDWTTWKCQKVDTFHEMIETYRCYEPQPSQMSRILLKIKGSKEPFLIGWGYDEQAANPREKAYAALHKDGRWIVGARGTGFTTKEGRNSITFYVFLDDKFSAREKIEIIFPQGDEEAKPVAEVTSSSGNGITPSLTDRTRKEISIIMFKDMKEINT
jgi:hypothetical protein